MAGLGGTFRTRYNRSFRSIRCHEELVSKRDGSSAIAKPCGRTAAREARLVGKVRVHPWMILPPPRKVPVLVVEGRTTN